jgi:hypothetical protein
MPFEILVADLHDVHRGALTGEFADDAAGVIHDP